MTRPVPVPPKLPTLPTPSIPQGLQTSSLKPVSSGKIPTDPTQAAEVLDLARWKFSDEGKVLYAWIKNEYSKCKSQRQPTQKQWEYNLMMYGGNQWGQLLSGNLNNPPKVLNHRIKSVTNLIRPMIRTEMSRMTNQKPSASVVPVSGSDDDIFAAQGGESVWESLYSRKRMHALDIRNAFWTALTGNGFRKTYWDKTIVDDTFLTVDPVFSAPQPTTGDIAFGVVTPFNLFIPDLLIEDIEDQPYVIEAYTKPVQWVNTFWKPYLVNPAVADVVGRREVFESSYFTSNTDASAVPDACLVIEAYIKAGAHYCLPEGGMVTIVGSEIVQVTKKWPYSHGEYPHAHTKHVITGKFYGASVLEDINSLQREYNRTRSQMIEWKVRSARPALLYTEGSINPQRVTSEPGQMIPVRPGYNFPTPLPVVPLPVGVSQELSVISADMETISGQHQVTKGNAPGAGITAATAISYLQDQDDSLMYTTYASIEQSYEKIAKQTLSIVAEFWTLPKIIRTVGTDGAFDSVELKGADIAHGLDIRVEAGSSLPTSKAARQAMLMDLMKFGAITPEQMLDLIDIGGIKKLTELVRIDMKAAQRENLRMKKLQPMQIMMADMQHQMGMQPDAQGNVDPNTFDQATGMTLERPPIVPVNEWDNHQIHIEVHNRFRKSQEFELLPEEVRTEFATHIRYHQVQLMIAQGGMMGQGQQIPQDSSGGGGDGGGPMSPLPPTPPDATGTQPALEGGLPPNGNQPTVH